MEHSEVSWDFVPTCLQASQLRVVLKSCLMCNEGVQAFPATMNSKQGTEFFLVGFDF